MVDERGMPTRTRKVSPAEWAEKFRERYLSAISRSPVAKEPLPANSFSIPGLFMQSVIFFRRDFLSKLAAKQYILISVFGAPVLALILAWFTRFSGGEEYRFSDNGTSRIYLHVRHHITILRTYVEFRGDSERQEDSQEGVFPEPQLVQLPQFEGTSHVPSFSNTDLPLRGCRKPYPRY